MVKIVLEGIDNLLNFGNQKKQQRLQHLGAEERELSINHVTEYIYHRTDIARWIEAPTAHVSGCEHLVQHISGHLDSYKKTREFVEKVNADFDESSWLTEVLVPPA